MAVFGLIDGNSFYCAVERAFQPELRGKPLVALSNNDGCVIARSAEAKRLGVKMGEPWHLVRRRPECRDLLWRSSNYALYGDVSRRVYEVLAARVRRVEPYSIDEMFLDLGDIEDVPEFCRELRDEVRRVAKIPCCIGVGPSKTIAKLANRLAKDREVFEGVCDLREGVVRADLYGGVVVGEVWGIGARSARKLEAAGVATVADFVAVPGDMVRRLLGMVGARTQRELQGVSCQALVLGAPVRQSVAVTRSFGRLVTGWEELREAVAAYAARAAEKLRREGLLAGRVSVFAHTSPFNGDPWFELGEAVSIVPTADTGVLIGEAVRLLRCGWAPGARFFKAGVVLADLLPAGRASWMLAGRDEARLARVMAAMDGVNARWGRGTLRAGAVREPRAWEARQGCVSPRFTTRLDEALVARAF